MKKRRSFLIIALVLLLTWSCTWQVPAASTICPSCGGRGFTTYTIHKTVHSGTQTFVVPETYVRTCGACGGTGRLQSYGSSKSSSSFGAAVKVKNGKVLDATDGIGNYEDGPNLLDGKTSTKFNVKDTKAYIIWEAPKKKRVKGYTITTANDTGIYTGRNPKSWVLYGSNKKLSRNAKGWKKIHSVKNDKKLKADNFKSANYKLKKKSKAYKYFKLEITSNKGADCTQLAEFKLK